MTVQQTSIASYIQVQPELYGRQKAVYDELKRYGAMSNTELASSLGLAINCLVPRIHELRKMGLVEFAGKRECRMTNRTVMTWKIKQEPMQMSLI